ncbi:MAG: hypothetical protein QOI63_553 [Thermoplasmata archaeon]|jgi:hypothetical protein|nr:hypothetical protein [Thermoplasmata archaeon]
MRKPPLVLLALAALLALPAAQAHVTITAVAPKDPLVPGVAAVIPVTASANCAVVLAEYNAMGKNALHWGLAPDAAKYWSAASADVAFDGTTCDPAGPATVTIMGTIAVTPSLQAPGLTPLGLTITAYNGASTTPEGGTPAIFNVTVAYTANVTIAAGTPVPGAGQNGSAAATYAVPITVTYSANAPSTLAFEGSATAGALAFPAAASLDSPSFTNKTTLTRTFSATFTPPAGAWTGADLTVMAKLTPKGAAAPVTSAMGTAHVTAPAPTASSGTSKASPAPSVAFPVALLGLALLRRR